MVLGISPSATSISDNFHIGNFPKLGSFHLGKYPWKVAVWEKPLVKYLHPLNYVSNSTVSSKGLIKNVISRQISIILTFQFLILYFVLLRKICFGFSSYSFADLLFSFLCNSLSLYSTTYFNHN